MAANEAEATSQLRVQAFTANCGNGSMGPQTCKQVLDSFFTVSADKMPDVMVINLQEADFKKVAKEIAEAVLSREIEQLYQNLADNDFSDAAKANEKEIKSLLRKLLASKDPGKIGFRLVSYNTVYNTLNDKGLLKKETQKDALIGLLQSSFSGYKRLYLAKDNMITRTNLSHSLDPFAGSAGIGQLIITNPRRVASLDCVGKQARSSSPKKNRRRGYIPLGSAYNKGGIRQQFSIRLHGQITKPFRIDALSGHLESKGPQGNGRAMRLQDLMNSLLPKNKVIIHPPSNVDDNFAELLREIPHSLITGYDMNTRNLIATPSLEVKISKGKYKAGLIDTDKSNSIDCWSSDQGKSDPGIIALRHAMPASQRYGGVNTFAENKTCKWSGKSLGTGDVDQKRVTSYNGNLDQVTAMFDGEVIDSHCEANEIKVNANEDRSAHKRDHSVIKSGVGSITCTSDFERVRNYMSRALIYSAPEVANAISELKDSQDNKALLIEIYHQYLDKGGLLEQRLNLHVDKLKQADALLSAMLDKYKDKAEQLARLKADVSELTPQHTTNEAWPQELSASYQKLLGKYEQLTGVKLPDDALQTVTLVRLDALPAAVTEAIEKNNQNFQNAWQQLQTFERSVLFEELYDDEKKVKAWFDAPPTFVLDMDALKGQVLQDKARLAIDKYKSNILTRLLASPNKLMAAELQEASVLISNALSPIQTKIYEQLPQLVRKFKDTILSLYPPKTIDGQQALTKGIEKIWSALDDNLMNAASADEVTRAFGLCQRAAADLNTLGEASEVEVVEQIKLVSTTAVELLAFNQVISATQRQCAINDTDVESPISSEDQLNIPLDKEGRPSTPLRMTSTLVGCVNNEGQPLLDRKSSILDYCGENKDNLVKYGVFQKLRFWLRKAFKLKLSSEDKVYEVQADQSSTPNRSNS